MHHSFKVCGRTVLATIRFRAFGQRLLAKRTERIHRWVYKIFLLTRFFPYKLLLMLFLRVSDTILTDGEMLYDSLIKFEVAFLHLIQPYYEIHILLSADWLRLSSVGYHTQSLFCCLEWGPHSKLLMSSCIGATWRDLGRLRDPYKDCSCIPDRAFQHNARSWMILEMESQICRRRLLLRQLTKHRLDGTFN